VKDHPIYKLHCNLLREPTHTFPAERIKLDITLKQGVYIIYNSKHKVVHVGKTNSAKGGLNQRMNDHLGKNSSFTKNYLKPNKVDVRKGYYFRYLEIENSKERTFVEAMTAGFLCPDYIGTGEKIRD